VHASEDHYLMVASSVVEVVAVVVETVAAVGSVLPEQ
jgi:hypothetical protein